MHRIVVLNNHTCGRDWVCWFLLVLRIEVDWCHSLLLCRILVQECSSHATSGEFVQRYLPRANESVGVILQRHPASSHACGVERIDSTACHDSACAVIRRINALLETLELFLSDQSLCYCLYARSLWNCPSFGSCGLQCFLRLRLVVSDVHLVFALSRVDAADLGEEITNIEDLARLHHWVSVLAPCVFLTWSSFARKLIIQLEVTFNVHGLVFRCNRALEVHLHGLPFFIKLNVGNVVSVNS